VIVAGIAIRVGKAVIKDKWRSHPTPSSVHWSWQVRPPEQLDRYAQKRTRGAVGVVACVKARRRSLAFHTRQAAPDRFWRSVDSFVRIDF